jgi:hypothetical protein
MSCKERSYSDKEERKMSSDVAQLRERIERECQAVQRMITGYATVSSHRIVNNSYYVLATYQEQLAKHVGEEEARRIIGETYVKIVG